MGKCRDLDCIGTAYPFVDLSVFPFLVLYVIWILTSVLEQIDWFLLPGFNFPFVLFCLTCIENFKIWVDRGLWLGFDLYYCFFCLMFVSCISILKLKG